LRSASTTGSDNHRPFRPASTFWSDNHRPFRPIPHRPFRPGAANPPVDKKNIGPCGRH
jgi:hypothetical protein